jgi:DNA-binding TFAR19-related protein (PDSD5 family)
MDASTLAAAKQLATSGSGAGMTSEQANQYKQANDRQQQMEEQKKQMLVQCLSAEAREVSL